MQKREPTMKTSIKMDDKTYAAWLEVKAHWYRFKTGTAKEGEIPYSNDCAFCQLFIDYGCEGCPIRQKTWERFCRSTPYAKVESAYDEFGKNSPEFKAAASEMYDFICSLGEEQEEVCKKEQKQPEDPYQRFKDALSEGKKIAVKLHDMRSYLILESPIFYAPPSNYAIVGEDLPPLPTEEFLKENNVTLTGRAEKVNYSPKGTKWIHFEGDSIYISGKYSAEDFYNGYRWTVVDNFKPKTFRPYKNAEELVEATKTKGMLLKRGNSYLAIVEICDSGIWLAVYMENYSMEYLLTSCTWADGSKCGVEE